MIVECLVLLLDGGLHQGQVLAEEALEAAIGPDVGRRLLFVLIGALLHIGLQLGLVLASLAQLGDQVVDLEALGILEQIEFVEDALDVVACDLIVGILEGLVFGNEGFGHLVGLGALLAHLLQILGGAQLVLGSGSLAKRSVYLARGKYTLKCVGVAHLPGQSRRTVEWQRCSSYLQDSFLVSVWAVL